MSVVLEPLDVSFEEPVEPEPAEPEPVEPSASCEATVGLGPWFAGHGPALSTGTKRLFPLESSERDWGRRGLQLSR